MVLRSLNSRVASLFLLIILLAAGCNPFGESSIDNNFGSQPRSDAVATPASLAFSPTSKAFGTAAVGSTTAQSVTITNTGGSSATNAYIAVTGTGFSLSNNNCGTLVTAITVAAWGSCTFDIVFAPSVSGAAAGSVTLSYADGTTTQTADMAVTGTGVNLASLSFAPTLKAFGNVTVGAGSTQSFTLSNSGVVAATDVFITISGTDYALANNTCGTSISTVTVGAAGNCTFDVIFTPGSVGAASGTVSLSYNDGSAVVVTPSVALTGTGISPGSLAFSPTSKAFGNVVMGANSTQSFTLTNAGSSNATSTYISITGTGYALANNNCGVTAARVTVAASGSCTFDVTFTPGSAGAQAGSVSLSYHDGVATQTTPSVSLTATGITAATLAFSPTSKAFGTKANGSSTTQSVTVTNSGATSATNVYISITGAAGYSLANNNCGTAGATVTLAAAGTCTFDAVFSPSSAGAAAETVSLFYNDGAVAQTGTMALTGTGAAPASLSFSVASITYGNQSSGTSSSATSVTLTNNGGVSGTSVYLAISGVFTLSSNNCGTSGSTVTVAAAGTCTFGVIFSPSAAGAASGSVTISYHDGANAQTTPSISLSGTGTAGGNFWDTGVWDTDAWGV